ncbi:transcriptional activator protein Pur-alpha-like isoform X5 [Tachypleus tridentatus]|uniref:transcriptional activator protein Pur-alpha-like isoform X5 n=1 Tax=Tachypleus tridentatus TaxID=6853 RepID=UPI003FD5D6FC
MAGSGERGQHMPAHEQELATKVLQIQSKRFYLDVKQNRRGRFIKLAEVGPSGRKSRLLLAMSSSLELRNHLTTFSELYSSLGPPNPDNLPEDGKLKSEVMVKDNKRYYLDLKENSRGRFLRVRFKQDLPEAQHLRIENKHFYFDVGQNSRGIYMRISEVKGNFRTAITIPEKSWSNFRDIFAEYVHKLKEFSEKPAEEGK